MQAPRKVPTQDSMTIASVIRIKQQAKKIKRKLEYVKASGKVLMPNSTRRLCWDFCNLTLLIYSVFEVPFSISFLSTTCGTSEREILNLCIDGFFMVDILLNFCTAYYDEEIGAMQVEYRRIARHYIHNWFIFDLLSSLPWDRFFCSFLTNNQSTRVLKILRLIKILRLVRIIRITSRIQDSIGTWASDSLRLSKFVGILFVFGHVCACIWHLVIDVNNCLIPADLTPSGSVVCGCDPSVMECQDWNWLVKYDPDVYNGNSTSARYLVSIYYSVVTLTTLGYGDVLPTNQVERGIASALALAGAVAFSFLISNISGLVSKGNAVEVEIEERLHNLSSLCDLKTVPAECHRRTRALASHMLKLSPHLQHDLSFLPRAYQTELTDSLVFDALCRLPLFQDMNPDCRARLGAVLRPCLFVEGAEVYRALDAATELYWVVSGEVELADACDLRTGRCGPGEIVGALEMFPDLGGPLFRVHTARARERCELLELRQADLRDMVAASLPDIYAALRNYAAERLADIDLEVARAAMAVMSKHRCRAIDKLLQRDASVKRLVAAGSAHSLVSPGNNTPGGSTSSKVHPTPFAGPGFASVRGVAGLALEQQRRCSDSETARQAKESCVDAKGPNALEGQEPVQLTLEMNGGGPGGVVHADGPESGRESKQESEGSKRSWKAAGCLRSRRIYSLPPSVGELKHTQESCGAADVLNIGSGTICTSPNSTPEIESVQAAIGNLSAKVQGFSSRLEQVERGISNVQKLVERQSADVSSQLREVMVALQRLSAADHDSFSLNNGVANSEIGCDQQHFFEIGDNESDSGKQSVVKMRGHPAGARQLAPGGLLRPLPPAHSGAQVSGTNGA